MATSTKKPRATAKSSRQLKVSKYKSFRLHKRVKQAKPPLPGSFRLFRKSLSSIRKHWRLFLGITLIYLVLTVVMVKGLGVSSGIGDLKSSLGEVFTGRTGSLLTGVTLFGVLVSSTSSSSGDVASVYQSLLLITTSLAVIWALRQSFASYKTTVRESYYKGMYPLVPFILVLLVIGLQLLPLIFGNWLYGVVVAGGIAVTTLEKAVWIVLIALLALLSIYMITSSVFALYICTLPDMTPMAALRSAREIVRYRRWTVMRKVLFLPFILLVLGAVVMLPIIWFATPIAEWVYLVLSMFALVVIHSYIYSLYREML